MADPGDLPERKPTIQPVWEDPGRTRYSFSKVFGWERLSVVVPWPWYLVTHPEHGAVYRPIDDRGTLTALGLVTFAREKKKHPGFRFATPEEIARA